MVKFTCQVNLVKWPSLEIVPFGQIEVFLHGTFLWWPVDNYQFTATADFNGISRFLIDGGNTYRFYAEGKDATGKTIKGNWIGKVTSNQNLVMYLT